MIVRTPWIVTFVVLLMVGFVAHPVLAGDATRIAAVDIQRVFESLEERTEIEASLQAKGEAIQAEQTERQNSLRDLQADLEVLAKGSAAYDEKVEAFEREAIGFQVWRDFEAKKINRIRAVQIEGLYRKILDTIGRVATDNEYDMVMFKEREANFAGAKPEQLLALIAQRKVLWASDKLDLTDQVIDRMNSERRNLP